MPLSPFNGCGEAKEHWPCGGNTQVYDGSYTPHSHLGQFRVTNPPTMCFREVKRDPRTQTQMDNTQNFT